MKLRYISFLALITLSFNKNCCVMRYTTAGQLWNIIAPREFVDFSYTTSYEDGLLTCGKPPPASAKFLATVARLKI